MPIYEYVCRECGHELEKLQKLSDKLLTDCSACGEPALKRKVSAAGFRLAGGGWYETDFKSEGKRNLAGDQAANGSAKKDGGEANASGSKDGKADKSTAKSEKADKAGKKTKSESATGSSATA